MARTGTSGVYFLANDPHSEWVRALLESVRAWNADIPIRLIPYDDDIDGLAKLASTYDFDVHADPSLAECDQLGARLLQGSTRLAGTFRKLACFSGPFDQFVYLDSDIVVSADVDRFVHTLDASHCDLTFAMHGVLERVYVSDAMQRDARSAGHALTVNTGAWASKRGLLPLEECWPLVEELGTRRSELSWECGEQSFVNWALMRRSVPVAAFATVLGRAALLWPGDDEVVEMTRVEGRPVLRTPSGATSTVVHWAGYQLSPSMPHREYWRWYRWPGSGVGARLARALDRTRTFVARVRRALSERATSRRSLRSRP